MLSFIQNSLPNHYFLRIFFAGTQNSGVLPSGKFISHSLQLSFFKAESPLFSICFWSSPVPSVMFLYFTHILKLLSTQELF